MKTPPYSIHVNKRPLRIAFLINPENPSALQQINKIISYNQASWGGRYNPIILTDGLSINDKCWKFLLSYDPDIIFTFVCLQKELLTKVQTFLTAYIDEPFNSNQNYESSHGISYSPLIPRKGLAIYPVPENISKITPSITTDLFNLIVFQVDQSLDEELKNFLHQNFGFFAQSFLIEQMLQKVKKISYKISDLDALLTAFDGLSKLNYKIYPTQICSLPTMEREIEYNHDNNLFTIIVGDSVKDLVYFWNRIFLMSYDQRTQFKQLYIPTNLTKNQRFIEILSKWFENHHEEINFISSSLSETQLLEIAQQLSKNSNNKISKVDTSLFAKYQSTPFTVDNTKNLDLYRGTTNKEILTLKEPSENGIGQQGYWMADIYIQFRPEAYKNFHNKTFWWQLPQRKTTFTIFDKQHFRVNANGSFSIPMCKNQSNLEINLPSDFSIFQNLIIKHPSALNSNNPIDQIKPSDKGKYLTGLLDLFSGLYSAGNTLQERYWRTMFGFLSMKKPSSHEENKKQVLNTIKKGLEQHGIDKNDPVNIEWWTKKLLYLSEKLSTNVQELTFCTFIKEARKELREFNNLSLTEEKQIFNKQALKNYLNNLLNLNILFVGIKPRCPACGYKSWYQIDEAQQSLKCKGCKYDYSISCQEEWYYKLNNLVLAGHIEHGLTPVILVLYQLLHDSKSSFIYTASVDLFKENDETTFGDLDIVCLQDGKFIIGEIKQSQSLFKPNDFDKMAEIAKMFRPDVLLFSSLDKEPSQSTLRNIERIKPSLSILEIEVKWYQLNSRIFEPSWIR